MQRLMLALAAALAAGIGLIALVLLLAGPEEGQSPSAISVAGADIGGPFELTDHRGRRVSSDELIDGPTLVYFGYTFCPDVCPVDVAVMAEAADLMAERGIEATPVFVTIDPARDTPEVLSWFADAMHPDMVGLTGSDEDIAAAAGAYKVYYARAEGDDPANYLMNHSAFIYLMTPDGLAALFRRGATPEEIAREAERVLG
ncbi:MAG TPA: SCO family protein [Thermohalobaculum sp.]|nr:SCO family protein [Thermohalobaculum sp.]